MSGTNTPSEPRHWEKLFTREELCPQAELVSRCFELGRDTFDCSPYRKHTFLAAAYRIQELEAQVAELQSDLSEAAWDRQDLEAGCER